MMARILRCEISRAQMKLLSSSIRSHLFTFALFLLFKDLSAYHMIRRVRKVPEVSGTSSVKSTLLKLPPASCCRRREPLHPKWPRRRESSLKKSVADLTSLRLPSSAASDRPWSKCWPSCRHDPAGRQTSWAVERKPFPSVKKSCHHRAGRLLLLPLLMAGLRTTPAIW